MPRFQAMVRLNQGSSTGMNRARAGRAPRPPRSCSIRSSAKTAAASASARASGRKVRGGPAGEDTRRTLATAPRTGKGRGAGARRGCRRAASAWPASAVVSAAAPGRDRDREPAAGAELVDDVPDAEAAGGHADADPGHRPGDALGELDGGTSRSIRPIAVMKVGEIAAPARKCATASAGTLSTSSSGSVVTAASAIASRTARQRQPSA